jgi:hypothetical protein
LTSSGSRARSCRPINWGYLKTGVDDDATLHANDAGFPNCGVRVPETLQSELTGDMRQAGTRSVALINAPLIVDRRRA